MLVSGEEPVEGSYELTGAFDGRQVVAIGDYRQGASLEAGGGVPCLRLRNTRARASQRRASSPPGREAVHQHLTLAHRVHLGAGHGQSGFQVARREHQPARLRQLLSWDACGVREEQRRSPRARW